MLQVGDFEAAGRGHGPLRKRQYDTSTLVRLLQFARASSVPAGWKRRRIGKGVRGFKLVMVSAVSASSWRFRGRGARARTCETLAPGQVECDESGAVGERLKRPRGGQWAKGQEVSVNLHWWSRRSALQVGDFEAAGPGEEGRRNKQQTTNNHLFLTYPRHLAGALSRWPSRGLAHLQRATRKGAPSSGKLSTGAWQAA